MNGEPDGPRPMTELMGKSAPFHRWVRSLDESEPPVDLCFSCEGTHEKHEPGCPQAKGKP